MNSCILYCSLCNSGSCNYIVESSNLMCGFVQVAKWNARTTQLIERYNQVDPDEYKQLIEERETRKQELAELKTQLESIKLVCMLCECSAV